jgi:Ca-activated chloride channel homolog
LIYRFENKGYLLFLLLIPVLVAMWWGIKWIRDRKIKRLGDQKVVSSIMPSLYNGFGLVKYVVLVFSILLILLGIANPQSGSQSVSSRSVGFEVNFVIDVSNSMLATDVKPSRMAATRRVLYNLSKQLREQRLGITVFAGEAFNQIPPTADPNIVDAVITSLSPTMVPTQGSNINAAIKLASQNFDEKDELNKFIILLTDGENHESDYLAAIKEAKAKGIVTHVIGVGTPKGGNIPITLPNGKKGLLKDLQGKVVVTAINEEVLQTIAQEGGGVYSRIENVEGTGAIAASINQLPRKVVTEQVYSNFSDYFFYFFIIAMILVLIEFFMPRHLFKRRAIDG